MSLLTFTGAAFAGGISSLLLSGINFSASQLTLPILYRLPAETSTSVFEEMFYRGGVIIVPLTIFSAFTTAFAAYLEPSKRRELTVAAVASVAPLAFTAIVMRPYIQRLCQLSGNEALRQKTDATEVNNLLKNWRWMNNVRSALSAIGGVTALAVLVGYL